TRVSRECKGVGEATMTEREAADAVTDAKIRDRVGSADVRPDMHLHLRNTPQRMVPPYSSTEVATAIGVSLDTFYRTRQIRHERDGLPAPISERGRLKWERTGFDAWLTRHHPMRPTTIANDTFAPPSAASDDEHRE